MNISHLTQFETQKASPLNQAGLASRTKEALAVGSSQSLKFSDHLKTQTEHQAKNVKQAPSTQMTKVNQLVDQRVDDSKKVIGQLVASTFIKPMLDEMRNSPFKNEMFHGGQGEQIFGGQLDTILSEKVTTQSDNTLVASIYARLEKQIRVIEKQRIMNQLGIKNTGKVKQVG